jgi:hypothetical protein
MIHFMKAGTILVLAREKKKDGRNDDDGNNNKYFETNLLFCFRLRQVTVIMFCYVFWEDPSGDDPTAE